MSENKRIDQLFDSARMETPKTAYNETKSTLLKATGVGVFGTLLLKWGFLSTKLKAIIMVASIGLLTVSVGLIFTSFGKEETKNRLNPVQLSQAEVSVQNVEIENTGSVETTTYLDEENNIIKVVVDSQKERKAADISMLPIDSFVLKPRIDVLEIPLAGLAIKPIIKDSTIADSTGNRVVFRITEKTTSEELETIFDKAKQAGLDVDYNTRIRRNVIKKINWSMSIDKKEGRKNWNSTISSSKAFSCMVGWIEDESGKAVDFIVKTKTSCCVNY
jgi:hypothetical protein